MMTLGEFVVAVLLVMTAILGSVQLYESLHTKPTENPFSSTPSDALL